MNNYSAKFDDFPYLFKLERAQCIIKCTAENGVVLVSSDCIFFFKS